METAHPVKFYDVVEPLIEEKIPLPSSVKEIIDKTKVTTKIDVTYKSLKEFLLQLQESKWEIPERSKHSCNNQL